MLHQIFNTEESPSKFREDDRALSVTVDHALGILILLIVVGLFVNSVAAIHDDRQQTVTEQELDRISEEVATTVIAVDKLTETGETRQSTTTSNEDITATTIASLPSTVASNSYNVQITEAEAGEEVTITVSSHRDSVETTVTLNNDIAGAAGSGDLIVRYDNGEEELTVETP